MRYFWKWMLPCLLASMIATGVAAQSLDDNAAEGDEDNGYFISLIEDQLSTESRKIRLSGIDGLLSSRANVKRITISDREGIWLQIDNAVIDWNRSALLRGRIEVAELSAERIRIPRKPMAEPGLPEAEASGFSIPELPVSVNLEKLAVGRIELGKPLLGAEAVVQAEGNLALADGTLDAALKLLRLDGAGGEFDLTAKVGGQPTEVDIDLAISEPQGGVIATLLGIQGTPPMEARIVASGPLTQMAADLDFRLDGEDLLDGRLELSDDSGTLTGKLALTGRLQPMLPVAFHPFFEGESTVDATGRALPEGGFELAGLSVQTGGLSVTGALRTAPDGFPQTLDLTAELGSNDGTRLVLPFGDGGNSVQNGRLRLTYGQEGKWDGVIRLDALQAGALRIGQLNVAMAGVAENLDDPALRRLTGDISGKASQLDADDPALISALGQEVLLDVAFDWLAGTPISLTQASLASGNTDISVIGTLDGTVFDGRASVQVPELAVFAAVSGRDLRGSIAAETQGSVDPLTGTFDLTFDGGSTDLGFGIAELDPLLVGQTTLSGNVRRSAEGLLVDNLSVANAQVQISADGIYSVEKTDFRFSAAVDQIGRITPQGSGRLELIGTAEGTKGQLGLDVRLEMQEGELQNRAVRDAQLIVRAGGTSAIDLTGTLDGGGTLDGETLDLKGQFSLRDGVQLLKGLELKIGRTRAEGTVARGADGLVAGRLDVVSPDLSQPAALALMEAAGAVEARVTFSRGRGRQNVALAGNLRALQVAGVAVGTADFDLLISDVLGIPLADGTAQARAVTAAGYTVTRLDLEASSADRVMDLRSSLRLDNGAEAAFEGTLENLQPGIAFGLRQLSLRKDAQSAVLEGTSRVELIDGEVRLSPLTLRVDDGVLTAQGVVGKTLDIDVQMRRIALDLANDFVPDLGVGGTISGAARFTGTTTAPVGEFDLNAVGLTAAPVRDLGLPPADIAAKGTIENRVVTLDGRVALADAARLAVSGTLPLDPNAAGLDLSITLDRLALAVLDRLVGEQGLAGEVRGDVQLRGALTRPEGEFDITGEGITATPLREAGFNSLALDIAGTANGQTANLDGRIVLDDQAALTVTGSLPTDPNADGVALSIALDGLPLSGFDALAGNQGLAGQVDATAQISGKLVDPVAAFTISGTGISAQPLRDEGIGALTLDAAGEYKAGVVRLDQASAQGSGGLAFSASGEVPLSGPGLDLRAEGAVPLALANVTLARSQSQLLGQLNVNISATGRLNQPNLQGSLNLAGGTFVNAPANLRLNDLALNATISGTRLTIANASASLAQGGTITVRGGITLDPAQNLPADLDIALREAFYTDGKLVTTQLSGDLAVRGPILGRGTVTGVINLERTEISLRSGFGINSGVLLNIEHRSPPRNVVLTLDRAGLNEPIDDGSGGGGLPLGLDVTVNVPNQLFVRGRGIDAELGGRVRITGSLDDIRPIGNIELIRGRLNILGQRIDFDEGTVTLIGDLVPRIRLIAETEATDGTIITIRVEGDVSDPQITFGSSPELPQDEVLAQLIFNRNVSDLSPFQIAQLAAAVATLAGGSEGLTGQFRSAAGLADFDITTGEDGSVGVRAGAYISENIYVDLEADSAGGTEATVNIDFSKYFTGRVSVDNRGESSVGVFFEKDY